MNFGNNLKKIRLDLKLTQEEFSKKIEISRTYLSDLENNRKNPSLKTINNIAEKLNVSVQYLTTGEKTHSDNNLGETLDKMVSLMRYSNDLTTKNEIEIFYKYIDYFLALNDDGVKKLEETANQLAIQKEFKKEKLLKIDVAGTTIEPKKQIDYTNSKNIIKILSIQEFINLVEKLD